jgi:hypothetical protein
MRSHGLQNGKTEDAQQEARQMEEEKREHAYLDNTPRQDPTTKRVVYTLQSAAYTMLEMQFSQYDETLKGTQNMRERRGNKSRL